MKKLTLLLVAGLILLPSMVGAANFKIISDQGVKKPNYDYGKVQEYRNPYGNLKYNTPGYSENDYSVPYRVTQKKAPKPEPKPEPEVIEITRVYQPYYTAINQEVESSRSWGAVPVNTNTGNTNDTNRNYYNQTNQNIPYTGTEGIWVLPFITQDHSAKEKQRILQTWGRVFRTPGYYPYQHPSTLGVQQYGNSNSTKTTTNREPAYLPTYSEYRKVNTNWAPRRNSGLDNEEHRTGKVTYKRTQ